MAAGYCHCRKHSSEKDTGNYDACRSFEHMLLHQRLDCTIFRPYWLNGLIFARVTKAWQQDVVSNDIQCEVPIEPLLVYI